MSLQLCNLLRLAGIDLGGLKIHLATGWPNPPLIAYFDGKFARQKALIISPTCLHNDFNQAVAPYIRDLNHAAPGDPIRIRYLQTFTAVYIQGV
jgi:hypothetical protein